MDITTLKGVIDSVVDSLPIEDIKKSSVASDVLDMVLASSEDFIGTEDLGNFIAKSVKETVKKNLKPKETKMDEDVQGTSKPEKLNDKESSKLVKAKAGKKDTKKAAKKDKEDRDWAGMTLDEAYEKAFGEQDRETDEREKKEAETKKSRHMSDEEGDERYHKEKDDSLTDPEWKKQEKAAKKKADDEYYSGLEADRKTNKGLDKNSGGGLPNTPGIYGKDYYDSYWGGRNEDAEDAEAASRDDDDEKTSKKSTKSERKPGGMSDEALDWGEDDDEAATKWDKRQADLDKHKKEMDEHKKKTLEGTHKGTIARDLREPAGPDEDFEEDEDMKQLKKQVEGDYKRAKRNNFDEAYVPSYAKNAVKGMTFKSLQEANEWKNPDSSMYKIRPTTTAERREFGQRMRFIVDEIPQRTPTGALGNRILKGVYNPKKDTLHGSKDLMPKGTIVHDVKNPSKHFDEQAKASGKNPATVLATRHKGPKGEPVVKPPHSHDGEYAVPEKEQKELRKDYVEKSVLKSLVKEVYEVLKDTDFGEAKIIAKEDKQAKPAKPVEKKTSEKLRAALLSGAKLKSLIFEIVEDVLKHPEFSIKAELRDGKAPGKPVTRASSDWVSRGEKTDSTGKPTHQKKDETPKVSTDRLEDIKEAKSGHDSELSERNRKAQAYLDSKKAIIKESVEFVLKNYDDYDKAEKQERASFEKQASKQLAKDENRMDKEDEKLLSGLGKGTEGWGDRDTRLRIARDQSERAKRMKELEASKKG